MRFTRRRAESKAGMGSINSHGHCATSVPYSARNGSARFTEQYNYVRHVRRKAGRRTVHDPRLDLLTSSGVRPTPPVRDGRIVLHGPCFLSPALRADVRVEIGELDSAVVSYVGFEILISFRMSLTPAFPNLVRGKTKPVFFKVI